ncbi:MAG TPA: hypothetical protein VMV10_11235 [Pirellulales bacterium]|nr:hypothetical protein [Pirellulales bacterium]
MADDVELDRETDSEPKPAPSGAAAGTANRFWQAIRPALDQASLNLRVWLPILSTPDMKGREIRYGAREHRAGLKWQIALPEQCWQCGKTEGLERRELSRSVRRFESPLSIISGTFGIAGALLVLWVVAPWGWPLKLAFLLVIVGAALLFVKSWKERVRMTIWTCPEHAEELTAPGISLGEDDLYVFVATESLAEAARAELKAARRRDLPDRPLSSGQASSGQVRPAKADKPAAGERAGNRAPSDDEPPPPSRPLPTRSELPPLKLAGDEEEKS